MKNRVALSRCLAFLAAWSVCSPLLAADPSPEALVRQGNTALDKGEYDKALEAYRQAEVSKPDAPELAFNEGIAHYRLRDFAKARELFGKALATRDLRLEGKAKFNLGNCKYSEALEKMSNLQEAIDHLRGAIEHYLDSLEIAPEDRDARANIESAQLLIKDLLDKLKNQQQQNPSSQPNQDQSQENQEKKEQGEQEEQQPGDQQQEEKEQPQGGEEQKEEQQLQQQQGQQGDEQQQPDEQKGQEGEEKEERQLTEEEAQRLLQAVRDKERERRDERGQRMRATRPKVARDW